ncbi:MAG: hypothetical protein IPO64_11210 [Bacteroidetes bacterium]|nr:hypothetical protein [Bacteroidota bacterium]
MESIKKVDPANFQITKYKQIINTYLSKEEIKVLHQKNDLFGTWEVIYNWIWIIGSFVLVALWTNVFYYRFGIIYNWWQTIRLRHYYA